MNAKFLLEILLVLDPPLRIKPETGQYIAKRFSTWRVSQFFIEDEFFKEDGERDSAVFALNEIYKKLDEKDYYYGLQQLLTSNQSIKNALVNLQIRNWEESKKQFTEILSTIEEEE